MPDFVAETDDLVLMLESKRASEMTSAEVLAKRDAGIKWCEDASAYAAKHSGKPWKYVLLSHDVVAENMTLDGLVAVAGR
jgi:type III restriction enzyme